MPHWCRRDTARKHTPVDLSCCSVSCRGKPRMPPALASYRQKRVMISKATHTPAANIVHVKSIPSIFFSTLGDAAKPLAADKFCQAVAGNDDCLPPYTHVVHRKDIKHETLADIGGDPRQYSNINFRQHTAREQTTLYIANALKFSVWVYRQRMRISILL